MFDRREISLNRVHDTVRVREGQERLTLRVDGDAMRMVAGLNAAQKRLQALSEGASEEEINGAALFFAGVMFGEQQARALLDFYRGDAACVVNVCGRYSPHQVTKVLEFQLLQQYFQ